MTINDLTPFAGDRPNKDTQTIDVFDTNVQTWVDFTTELPGSINTFISQLTSEILTFAQNIAGATANVSIYDAGTTYSAGAQVLDPANNYRMYTSQQGFNTGNTPSENDGTYWRDTFGNTGADTISSAVDITLTSASKQIQVITITSADKFVVLPDATGFQKSKDTFVFFNKGAYRLGIKDSSGQFICSIPAYGQGRISLTDNSTAAGVWQASSDSDLLMNRIKTVCNSNSDIAYLSTCKLTSTEVFVAWQGVDNDGFCAVLTYDGASISVSNIFEFSTTDVVSMSVCRMSDTTAIIAYQDPDSDGKCTAITYDGINTLTSTHTYEFVDASTISNLSVISINESDTLGRIFVFYYVSGIALYYQVLNWDGSAISGNTAATSVPATSTGAYTTACLISGSSSSASILIGYVESSIYYIRKVTWSGTALSATSAFNVTEATSSYNTIVSIDANYSVAVGYTNDTYGNRLLRYQLLYFNGTTFVKKKIIYSMLPKAANFTSKSAGRISADTILFSYSVGNDSDFVLKLKVVGASSSKDCILQIDSMVDIGVNSTTGALLCNSVLSENGAMLVYKDADTTYLAAQYVDIG